MAGRLTLDFLKTERSAGLAPAGAAALAVILANSPLAGRYFGLVERPFPVQFGGFSHTASVEAWVRDGLMAAFFLVLGLEIKFEVLRGELSSPRRVATPILAAVGGMVVPALIYWALNQGAGGIPGGWPVATPTDIAFALAALAIAAPALPDSLRLFLMTLAVAGDFGAVALIGVLYSHAVSWRALAGAAVALALLAGLSRVRRAPLLLYAAGFVVVWAFCLESGVNTSVAAIACALTVPVGARRPGEDSMLTLFMNALHPWVAFGVLPLFAFTAAGIPLRDHGQAEIVTPVSWGVVVALVVGKPIGVFGSTALAAILKIGRKPTGASWLQLLGVSLLAGIGFTMSLYLAGLAFGRAGAPGADAARLGVIAGSLISAALGAVVLARSGGGRR